MNGEKMKKLLAVLVAAAAVGLIGGCGGGSDDGQLKPADEVQSSAQAKLLADVGQVKLGDAVKVADGVTVTVTNPSVDGDDSGTWLVLDVRAENHSKEDVKLPAVGLRCGQIFNDWGSVSGGSYNMAWGDLPAGSFADGDLRILRPGDGRYGQPVSDCATPAELVVSKDEYLPNVSAMIPLDDSLIAELNAHAPASASTAAVRIPPPSESPSAPPTAAAIAACATAYGLMTAFGSDPSEANYRAALDQLPTVFGSIDGPVGDAGRTLTADWQRYSAKFLSGGALTDGEADVIVGDILDLATACEGAGQPAWHL